MTFTLSGTVYKNDGTTHVGANTVVYVYNKTNDELHNGNEGGNFANLITDSNGAYSVDLDDFTTAQLENDIIFVSATYQDDTAMARFLATGSSKTQNLTMQTLEPVMNITDFLKMFIKDYNAGRANTNTMITPYYPRSQNLSKSSYPRIAVNDLDESSSVAGITALTSVKQEIRILITLFIWAKEGDFQKLTILSDNYEGTRLRDWYATHITDQLRKRAYVQPSYNIPPHLSIYYNFKVERKESLEFSDEGEYGGILRKEIEISFNYIKQG